ncbi:vascular endothelial growth factor B isoform X8 [Pipistrellus kuhlii]|uniref:vascular endothelial growth factor B isoform X8 n=1 Tax=Pipistrellus kuhlii TaxID=59472 RepID=UPI001E271A3F|nr:vascular endothelial growth factor B isoform X8 [Pipistrellus kuhlii]
MGALLRRLLLAALLQLARAQASCFPQAPGSQPDAAAAGHQKKGNSSRFALAAPVVSWIDVYARATCQPREVVVPLTLELMGTVAKQLVPSCVTLQRCGGCCPDDGLECVPTGQHQVRMQTKKKRGCCEARQGRSSPPPSPAPLCSGLGPCPRSTLPS